MNISRPFILRPVATSLLMIAIMLVGMLAFYQLPVSALPEVDYPTIEVQTFYPGASPDVMTSSVTAPLERQFGEVPGLSQMTSTSSQGSSLITLQFSLELNIDVAEQEVQAAINSASSYLPSDLPNPPIYSKTNPADTPILTVALTSKSLALTQVEDLADTRLAQKISQLSGVGLVSISGGQRPAVLIDINPVQLSSEGLNLEDVRTAIAAANVNGAKGTFDGRYLSYTIGDNDQLLSADDYRKLVIAYRNNAAILLKDVATVTDGAENTQEAAWMNQQPAVILNIQRQPGANIIAVVDRVKALLPTLQASLPNGVNVDILTDRTVTIRASVEDVEFELCLTVLLVVLVIFVFLRNVSATIIPSVAVPLSLVGTFGVMYLLGYSLNNLTLMALTISTGFVVDDAIVMIENIVRYIEEGEAPFAAALKGSQQIGFTILSLSVSLIAVLIPLLFMGDIVGRLFREFAVTLSVTILVSAVVSLTLTPMMCAKLLRHKPDSQQGRFFRASERVWDAVINVYARTLDVVLRHQTITLLIAVATLGLTIWLYVITPKGFFPVQDTGVILGISQGPQDVSFTSMSQRQQALAKVIDGDTDVASLSSFIGIDGTNSTLNSGRIQINLKPLREIDMSLLKQFSLQWPRVRLGYFSLPLPDLTIKFNGNFGHFEGTRTDTASDVIRRLETKLTNVPGITLFMQPVQDLSVEDRVSRTQYQYTLEDPDPNELATWVPQMVDKMKQVPFLRDVATDQQNMGLEANLVIDRDTASRLGITPATIDNTLYDAFGQRQVSTMYTQTNQYHVVEGVLKQFAKNPKDLTSMLYVKSVPGGSGGGSSGGTGTGGGTPSAAGGQVPLSAITHLQELHTSLAVNHQGQFPVSTISFNLAPGASLGQAVDAVNQIKQELQLPASIQAGFQGTAEAFQVSLTNEPLLILAAIVTVYIVLGVLYESYIHPITILSTLPSAAVGAFLALQLTGNDFSVIALIGIILLIGIVKKNAIMMIDFALDAQRHDGKDAVEAIYQACLLRLRPILMTTMAALLGAVPLAMGTGVGAELRRPLGITMIGGLIFSQLLTLYTTPVIYLWFDRLGNRLGAIATRTPETEPTPDGATPAMDV